MQNLENTLDLRPSLIGTITISATALGAPVDTQGFGSVLAVLMTGASFGTGGNTGQLDVKIQECASLTGTGTAWSDIENGTVSGTFAFDQIVFADGTDPRSRMGKKFEIISDGTRLRYIRAHATMAGTDSVNPKVAVGFLLGEPVDTVHYITNPTVQATGNTQYTVGV